MLLYLSKEPYITVL